MPADIVAPPAAAAPEAAGAAAAERERAFEWKERAKALEAELRALRMHAGLPWWRRLLTTTAAPADAIAIPVGAK